MIYFRLKEILKEKNVNMIDLADKTGISRTSLSKLSTGKSQGIQFDTLDKIMESLDVRVQDLFSYTPNNKNLFIELDIKGQNEKNEFANEVLPSGLLKIYRGTIIIEDTVDNEKYYSTFTLRLSYIGEKLNTYIAFHLDYSSENDMQNIETMVFDPSKVENSLLLVDSYLIEAAYEITSELIANSFSEYERHIADEYPSKFKTNKEGVFSFEFSFIRSKEKPSFEFVTQFDKNYIYIVPDLFEGNDKISIEFNTLDN